MSYLLYFIAILLILGWLIGFFVYSIGALIHLLLAIAGISILVAIFAGNFDDSRMAT